VSLRPAEPLSVTTLTAQLIAMSSLRSLLWPLLFVFRITGALPLTSQFAPSRWGQIFASLVVIFSVTLGCVKPYLNITKSSFKPEKFMQIIGVLLSIFSAIASFFIVNFKIKEASKFLKTLQMVHVRLNVGFKLMLIFSIWVPFLAIYLIPLLFKVFNMVFFFKSWLGLLVDASSAARFNYLNASVLTFVVTCHVMGIYYKEILKQLEAINFKTIGKFKRKNFRLENLKYCHLHLFQSVESVKNLYGIHILFGLVTSNMYFQMSMFELLQKMIKTNEYWLMPSKFVSTFLFLSLDIGRIILCFTSSNIICKQVKSENYVLIFSKTLCILESTAKRSFVQISQPRGKYKNKRFGD